MAGVHYKGSSTFCCSSDAPCDEMKSVWRKPAQSDAPSAEPERSEVRVQWTGDAECLKGTLIESHYKEGAVQRIDKAIPIRFDGGEKLCRVGDWLVLSVNGILKTEAGS